MKPVGGDDELQWTAACYVLGELSSDEMTRFEARLLEDQTARETLADAVELMQAATLPKLSTVETKRSYVIPAISSIITICLLVGVAAYFTPPATPTAAVLVQANPTAGVDDWILELPELLEEQIVVDVDDAEPTDSLIPAAAEETDGDIPGWLILATSKEGTP